MRHLFLASIVMLLAHSTLCAEEFMLKRPPYALDERQEAFIKGRYTPDVLHLYVGGMIVQVEDKILQQLQKTEKFANGTITFHDNSSQPFSMQVVNPQARLKEIRDALNSRDIYAIELSTGERYLLDQHDWMNVEKEKGVSYLGRTISERQQTRYNGAIVMGVLMSFMVMGMSIIDRYRYAPIRTTPIAMVASCAATFWEITEALNTFDIREIGFKGMLPFSMPIAMAILWSLLPEVKKTKSIETNASPTSEEQTEA